VQPILFRLHGPNLAHNQKKGIPAFLYGRLPLPTGIVLSISGITRDSTGVILGSCAVSLYRTLDNQVMETTTSDPSTGAYSFSTVASGSAYYVVAYKAGSPDVAGTTVNTLVGA
jgi:hypothetical protein